MNAVPFTRLALFDFDFSGTVVWLSEEDGWFDGMVLEHPADERGRPCAGRTDATGDQGAYFAGVVSVAGAAFVTAFFAGSRDLDQRSR